MTSDAALDARRRADDGTILHNRPTILKVGTVERGLHGDIGIRNWEFAGPALGVFTTEELAEIVRLKAEGRLTLEGGTLVWRAVTREDVDAAVAELIEIAMWAEDARARSDLGR